MVTSTDERRFYHVLIRVVFLAVTADSLIALLGEQFWVAELFTHFRLYYLLIQALLVLIFLYTGRRVLMILSILFAIPNAWVVGPYLTPAITSIATLGGKSATAGIGNDVGIGIVALNVNYRNEEFARIAGYLRDFDPDIIVIAEFTPAWRDELEFLRDSHPWQLGAARNDQWGLAVFSRLPLVDTELIDLAQTDSVHVRFVIEAETAKLEVFAVHLFSPTSSVLAHNRNLQLENLAERVAASEYRSIVVGDLNLTPFSPYFSRFIDRSGLLDARRLDGFHVTWPASAVPVWIPIDHALADAAVNVAEVRTGPDVGSDHLPLEILVAERARDIRGHDKTATE